MGFPFPHTRKGIAGSLRALGLIALTATLALPSSVHAQCSVVGTEGLIGHWKLDEASGNAADSAGSNTGTASGGPTYSVTGQVDTAINFDGSNDQISMGDPGDGSLDFATTDNFSIAVWARSAVDDAVLLAKKTNGGEVTTGYMLNWGTGLNPNVFEARVSDGTAAGFQGELAGTTTVTDGNWHHVVATFDRSGNATLYVDGQQEDSEDMSAMGSFANTDSLFLARDSAALARFSGDIDDVRIYDRVLSANEVVGLYNQRSNAGGVAGQMTYNAYNDALIYCDDTDWRMAGTGPYNPSAVYFDDTNDYLDTSTLTGTPDSDKFTTSFWFKIPAGADENWDGLLYEGNAGGDVQIYLEGCWNTGCSDDLWELHGRFRSDNTTSNEIIMEIFSSNLNEDTWYNALLSWDSSVATGPAIHLYINDADAERGSGLTSNADSDLVEFDGNHVVGGADANDVEVNLADFWVDVGTYIDFSIESNRRKFISSSGMPMYLGEDGSFPTGSQPDIFMSGDTANWHTNKGAGGGFTENGAITTAASQPGTCTQDSGPLAQAGNTYNTTGDAYGVWGDGTYIYVADGNAGLHAFSFDGTDFTLIDTYNSPGFASDIWTDGTYIYLADGGAGIHALTFNGTAFTHIDQYNTSDWALEIMGDGTYIYVADNTGFAAYSFDGSTLTQDRYQGTWITALWVDSAGVIHASDNGDDLEAYSFNGSTFSNIDQAALSAGGSPVSETVFGDSNYIYTAQQSVGIEVFSFDGSSYTSGTDYNSPGSALGVWSDGTYVYLADGASGIRVLTYDGSWTSISNIDITTDSARDIWSDGLYIYVAEGTDGVKAYSGFSECNCKTAGVTPGVMTYNSDFNVMQYCNGTEWVAMGPVGGTPPASNLYAHWKMDDAAGGTTVTDDLGSHNGTWTPNGGSSTIVSDTGQIDDAIVFNDNEYVRFLTTTTFDTTGNYTLSTWVRGDNAPAGSSNRDTIINVKNTFGMYWDAEINNWTSCEHYDGSWKSVAYPGSTNNLQANVWYHLACVYDGTDLIFYVDGAEINRTAVSAASGASGAPNNVIAVGANVFAIQEMRGDIDDVRVYSRGLSAQEISQLYNFGRSGGLGDVSNTCTNAGSITGSTAEGIMFYNSDENIMQYCNGEEWIGIGK